MSSASNQTDCGTHVASYSMGTAPLPSSEIKQPGCEASHPCHCVSTLGMSGIAATFSTVCAGTAVYKMRSKGYLLLGKAFFT